MSDYDIDLARISNNIAPVFRERGWRWRSSDSNRSMYIPNSAHVALTLARMMKDLQADSAVISSTSGRLNVERDPEFSDRFQVSVEFGSVEIEKEPDDEEAA